MNLYNSFSSVIDINGLGCPKDISILLRKYPYWMQLHTSQIVYMPANKPPIKDANSINLHINILQTKVIKTPISNENLEGKILTGRKLIIEGQICVKVVYTASNDSKSIHSYDFYIPFSSYIVVPKSIILNEKKVDSVYIDYNVDTCIEDFSIQKIEDNCLLVNITLLILAIPI